MKTKIPKFIIIAGVIINFILLYFSIQLWIYILTSHTTDSNIFGIYYSNGVLHVGDFWCALYLVWLPIKGVRKIMDNVEKYMFFLLGIKDD